MNSFKVSTLLAVALAVTAFSLGYIALNVSDTAPLVRVATQNQTAQVSASLSQGLISHWKFDEGSGSSVSASVGGGSDTLGSPSWISGKVGGALSFNGSDYVNLGNISSSQITISAWIKPTITSGYGSVAIKQNTYGIETQGNTVYAGIGNGSAWSNKSGGHLQGSITGGTWQLITQTFDGTTNRLYINGSQVASGPATLAQGSEPFLIGSWNTSFFESFNGGIDDVRIYNRALTANEVAELAGATVTPPVTPAPTATLSVSPTSLVSGSSANLTWSSTNATACTATGGTFAGTKTTSGTQAVSPTATTAYGISCTGTGGTSSAVSTTVTVTAPTDTTAPVVSAVSATAITTTGATISYTTNEASDTYIEYGLTTTYGSNTTLKDTGSAMKTSHSDTLSGLAAGTVYNYRVKSKDAAGNTATSANFTFTTVANAPTVTLSVVPNSLVAGGATTITWSSNGATSCTATGGTGTGAFSGTKATSGSASVTPTADTTYGISCTGTGGTTAATPVSVTISTAPPVNPLTAQWKFDEASGTSATDSSGNGRTATIVGSARCTTGASGNGLCFNGSARYVNAGNIKPKGFTLSAWVNMSANQSGWGSIAMKRNSYGLEVQNGKVFAKIGNGKAWVSSSEGTLSAGVWHHVAQVYTGSSNILYIDGKQVATNAATLTNNDDANLLIGSWDGSSEFFNGNIDEVTLHSSALIDRQVFSLYRSIAPGSGGTADVIAPSVPSALTATAVSSSQINLSWNASSDAVGVTGYKVFRSSPGVAVVQIANITPAATTFQNISGLLPSTTYTYTISAYDAVGNTSAISASVSATTPAGTVVDTTAPPVPTGLVANVISSTQINLSWTASPASAGTTGYNIYRGGTLLTTVTTPSYVNTGLTAATSYSYTVSAYDAAGNVSARSSAVSATTQATPSYTLTVAKGGTGTGTVSSTGSINCGTSCTSSGDPGMTVSLTAAPASGSTVSGWTISPTTTILSGCTTTSTACSFVLNANTTVTVAFSGGTTPPPPTGTTINVTPSTWGNLTFVRGNTYVLAPGTYSGKNLNTPVDGTKVITIKSDGTGQAVFTSQIAFNSSNWVFDGVTGGGAGNWTGNVTPFGFKVIEKGDGSAIINIAWSAPANNIAIRHVDMEGKGSVSNSGGSYSNDGLANYGGSNVTLSYAWLHGIGRVPFFIIRSTGGVIEHTYVTSYYGQPSVHSALGVFDGRGVGAGTGTMGDNTFRYNLVTDIESTGGLMWDNVSNPSAPLYVYGNVFYKPAGASWDKANGVIGGWYGGGGEQFHSVKVYNNTFVNVDQQSLSNFPQVYSGNIAKNNLWVNSDAPTFAIFTTNSHNDINLSANPFATNFASTLNFSLSADTAAGDATVPAQYRTDMFGRTGTTRGAVQYTGTTPPPPVVDTTAPPVPTGLVANVISSTQINLSWTASPASAGTTGYNIYRGGALLTTVTTPSYVNTGLTAATSYSYTVSAYDAAGNVSARSSAVSATTATVVRSTKFTAGASIQVSGTGTFLNIRSAPSTAGTSLGTAADGVAGTVVTNTQNGVFADGYYWWYVTLNGVTGWAAENFLVTYTAPATYTLSVTRSGTTAGSVSGGGVTCDATDCVTAAPIAVNTAVTLTATAGVTWTGCSTVSGNTCTIAANSVAANAVKTVNAQFSPVTLPSVSLSADPTNITTGESSILTWSSTGATSCTATGGTFAGAKAISGSQTVTPTVTTTYGITCVGATGTSPSSSVTVVVSAPVAPYTVSVTKAGTGTGTISSSPAGITSCSTSCSATFTSPSVVLTAAPAALTNVSWAGCSSISGNSCTVTGASSVTATFSPIVTTACTAADGTCYVTPSATGNGSGADAANTLAWSSLTPARGKTYILLPGTYSGKNLNTPVSGTQVITIKSSGSTNPVVFTSQIAFNSSNWVFDGVTGGGAGNWTGNVTPFGFKVISSSDGGAIFFVGNGSTANNITIRHVDMQGKGSVSNSGGSMSNDGLAIYGDSDVTLSYAWMHGIGRCPFFFAGNVNTIMEHIYVQSYYGSSGTHSEVMSSGQGFTGDTTFRYNLVTDIKSTGGLMWDNSSNPSSHLYVYGNVFYKPAGAVWEQANGVIGGWTGGNGEQFRNAWVYNNTFINVDQQSLSNFPNVYSGNIAKNNLWVNSDTPNFEIFTTNSHNDINLSANPFATAYASTLNFSLKANTAAGDTTVPAQYRTDMFGRTGTTRGAVQF